MVVEVKKQANVSLIALESVLEKLTNELGSSGTLAQARVLLHVASAGADGIDQGVLGKQLDISQSACVRAVRFLGSVNWTKDPKTGKYKDGLGYIRVVQDPQDFRLRQITLSEDGVAALKRLGVR